MHNLKNDRPQNTAGYKINGSNDIV